jgi:hypothetical protein
MAVLVEMYNEGPIFGATWFSTSVTTDFDNRTVLLNDLKITNAKFPDIGSDSLEKLREFVLQEIGGLDMTMSLDRFLVSLEELESRDIMNESLNSEPPKIFFRTNPAILVFVDGEPILGDADDEDLKYVMNTPYFIVWHPKKSKYYLNGGDWWYETIDINNEWRNIKSPPKKVLEFSEKTKAAEDGARDSSIIEMDIPPEIIVSTEPAELITSDGEPSFKVVEGTDILYMENTESDILMHIVSQKYYILLSGRWFTSTSMTSDEWTHILPDDIPDEFLKIAEDSPIADVRTSIPGTDEAKEAVLENSVPQTAQIERVNTTVEVSFDGDPQFEKISNTDVSYALNSDKVVLLIAGKYYCVDEAVWFEANKTSGPWEVCVKVPSEVNDIPPESPVYNVKYVYVYHYTPEVVYVGYTPGYYGSYVYYGTVVYGTGYYYYPWYHTYYYPRPVTYGFGVHYNPYTGWGFSVGVSYGWLRVTWRPYYRRCWGPAGYRYGYRHGYRRGAHRGYRHGYSRGYNAGRRAGYSAGNRSGKYSSNNNNMYRNRDSGVRSTGAVSSGRSRNGNNTKASQVPKTSNRSNNLYTDPKGNVYRRDNSGGWEQRSGGQWKEHNNKASAGATQAKPATAQTQPKSSTGSSQTKTSGSKSQSSYKKPSSSQSYNPSRDYQNRSRGTQRSNTYNRSYGGRGGGRR